MIIKIILWVWIISYVIYFLVYHKGMVKFIKDKNTIISDDLLEFLIVLVTFLFAPIVLVSFIRDDIEYKISMFKKKREIKKKIKKIDDPGLKEVLYNILDKI